MKDVLFIVMWMAILKALFVGSEFNLFYWFKDGRQYTDWYWNRPSYPTYLKGERNGE